MNRPLVSVMMPCYNAARTLPRALASLVAQTYTNWECILVDDGSTDRPLDVVEGLGDPRIKTICLDLNRGRGGARQVAIENASGELLCMLDADDWLYPTKIERQVEVMECEPGIALVSAGLAIVDGRNELVGVRCRGPARPPVALGPVTRPGTPPVAFGPSMMRMGPAKAIHFDPGLPSSEDQDFLISFLLGRCYLVLPDVFYAYRENASPSLGKVVADLGLVRRSHGKHRDRFPISSRWHMGKTLAKETIYRGAFSLGLDRWLIARRSSIPTPWEADEFMKARWKVDTLEDRLFYRTSPGTGVPSRPRGHQIASEVRP
ncbi:MAG: hypothetical protein NVSMB9_18460 [Isosphaeraceae bacterium]